MDTDGRVRRALWHDSLLVELCQRLLAVSYTSLCVYFGIGLGISAL